MSHHLSVRMEEKEYDQLATGPWPSWNDDSFNGNPWDNNPDIFEDSCISADYSLPLTLDSSDSVQFLAPSPQIGVWALGSASKSTDYIPQLNSPGFEPLSMMDVISPLSSGGTTWTSPPLELDFDSPVIDTIATMPQLGAFQLDKMTHVGDNMSSDAVVVSSMDTAQQSPTQLVPKTSPWDGVQKPPPLFSNDCRPLTMEDRPSHISAREWRMLIRPEKCPVCEKGHSYQSEVKKHIIAQHRHLAPEYGLSTERSVCKWCGESVARGDHLTRHMTRKHGRPKYAKRRRKGEPRDGT